MGLENVKYDAFISYRHSDLDKYNAMTIQRKLENFKLPKSMYGKTANGKNRIERVFRDQDELPLASNLSDPIEDALENSEFLIVICTPRLPESKWCAKEIDTFIKLHGREHVLAVLAEGEPEESFPEALRYTTKIVSDDQGNSHEERVEIEPLAADTRGSSKKEINKKIDDAILRIAAPIFGLNYDDLKQRHKEQRTKKLLTIAGSIASAFFIFAMVCMFLAIRINSQKNTIAEQYDEIEAKNIEIEANNREITAKNEEITARNEEITAKNEEISRQYREEQLKYAESMADVSKELLSNGRRMDAVYAVRNAMPSSKADTELPYSAAAEKALTEALGYYDHEDSFVPGNIFELPSAPTVIVPSPDGRGLVVVDSADAFHVFDSLTGEKKTSLAKENISDDPVWIDENRFIFRANTDLTVYNIESAEETIVSEESDGFVYDPEKKIIYSFDFDVEDSLNYLRAYSTDDLYGKLYEVNITVSEDEPWYFMPSRMAINESGTRVVILSFTYNYSIAIGNLTYTLSVIDTESHELILEEILNLPRVTETVVCPNNILLLATPESANGYYYVDSEICSININTGDIEWKNYFAGTCFTDMLYVNTGYPEVFLDSNGYSLRLDAETGEQLAVLVYSDRILDSNFLPDGKNYSRTFVTADSSIWIYDTSRDSCDELTNTLCNYVSSKPLIDVASSRGYYYYLYANESYIAQYSVRSNPNMISCNDVSEIMGDDADSEKYRDDCKYAVTTVCVDRYADVMEYEHSLYNLEDGSKLCTVRDFSSYVVFVPGSDDSFVTYSNTLTEYSYSGEIKKTAVFGDYSQFPDISKDGRSLLYPVGFSSDIAVVSLESFEQVAYIQDGIYPNEVITSAEGKVLASIKADSIGLYRFGETEPYLTKEIDKAAVYSFVISDDGKYLFLNYKNMMVDVLSMEDLSRVTSLYSLNTIVNSVSYSADTNSYLVMVVGSRNMILNDKMEINREIYSCRGYDPSDDCYIIFEPYTHLIYRIPYLSYDELVKKADELLGDYEPSEYIKLKYHM